MPDENEELTSLAINGERSLAASFISWAGQESPWQLDGLRERMTFSTSRIDVLENMNRVAVSWVFGVVTVMRL